MPIKRVVCSICQTEVNKAQTYHVGDGNRACKTHQGVTEKKESLEKSRSEGAKKALETAARRAKEREDRFYQNRGEEFSLSPRCWVCKQTGMRAQEFFSRLLIEGAKAEQIYGTINPFDFKHPGNKFKIAERCIFVLMKDKCQSVLKFLHGDFRMLVDLAGAVAICGPCCGKHGIDPLPKVEFDELVKFSAIYEVAVKPVVDQIAIQEMSRDQ